MKTIKYLTTIALFLLLLAAGCDKRSIISDNPTDELFLTPINIPIERYSLIEDDAFQWYYLGCDGEIIPPEELHNKMLNCDGKAVAVINNDSEMQSRIISPGWACLNIDYPDAIKCGPPYPVNIDFEKHTLILAKGIAPSGISSISGWNLKQLSPNKYKLNVELTLNRAAVNEPWVIAFTTNGKLGNECKVEVNVTTIDDGNEKSIGGTWKLINAIEAGTEGTILRNNFFPKDSISGPYLSRESYCLNFSPDKTIFGTSVYNYVEGNYKTGDSYSIQINIEAADGDIYESGYGKNFIHDMNERVEFYAVSGDRLKLYLKSDDSYLSYSYLLFERWDGKIELPDDIHAFPIDWSDYNSVYSVSQGLCSFINCEEEGYTVTSIKLRGWIATNWLEYTDSGSFYLTYNRNGYVKDDALHIKAATPEITEQLKTILANENLSRLCYITGELHVEVIYDDSPSRPDFSRTTFVVINNIDDIYFE